VAVPVDSTEIAPGGQFLRDEHRKSLRAFFVPIVNAGEQFELVIEVVVQNGDERRTEGVFLLVSSGTLHLQRGFRDAVDEQKCARSWTCRFARTSRS